MVISNFLQHSIFSAQQVARGKFFKNPVIKSLFEKRIENLLLLGKRNYGAYDGDGRTVGFIINQKSTQVLQIDKVKKDGFVTSQGSQLLGSVIIFPQAVLSWNVLSAKDVNENSLILFKLLDPKIDILVFGYGSNREYTPEVRTNFTKICKKLNLRYEALPTEQAIGVFNILAYERRLVAGALIPPLYLDPLRFDKSKDYLEDYDDDDDDDYDALKAITDDIKNQKLIK